MARLFQRDWLVSVHTVQFDKLDITFDVEKSTKREPNKCSLRIWNLNASNRLVLESLTIPKKKGPGQIRVALEAGHVGARSMIFLGDLRTAKTIRDGADLITEIEGDDGGRSALWSRINQSFGPGTPVSTVIEACAKAMGVGMGNVLEATRGTALLGGGSVYAEGTTLSGSAATELEHLLRSVGKRYSIQNGAIQILDRGMPLQGTSVLLTPQTGLIGRPEMNADGTVLVKMLLQPDIYPGRQIKIESPDLVGPFRIERAKYTGETAGVSWYIDAECKPLVVRGSQ